MQTSNGTQRVWSDAQQVPYLISGGTQWVTYEDEQSLTVKVSCCAAYKINSLSNDTIRKCTEHTKQKQSSDEPSAVIKIHNLKIGPLCDSCLNFLRKNSH
jgi:GH18 family chitinase